MEENHNNIDSNNKPRIIDQIGDRMKDYEKKSQNYLQHDLPAVARIDGHCFSKWTKGFNKPNDERLHNAMVETTKDLVRTFQFLTGFTQSDEITLIFAPNQKEDDGITLKSNYFFNGKVQKIASVLASFTAVRFTFYMMKIFSELEVTNKLTPHDITLFNKIKKMTAHFDARVFNLPDEGEVLNNIMWRSRFDCVRNSVSSLAHANFKYKEIHGLGTNKLKEKLLTEKSINWDSYPHWYKYGTFIKRQLVEKNINEKLVIRCQTVVIEKEPMNFSKDNIEFLFSKYYV